MKNKEIIELLQTKEVKFNIKGVLDYNDKLKIFKIEKGFNGKFYYVKHDYPYSTSSMNVDRFGPTAMWLFSYDMMGNRTTSKVKYEDITILED